MTKERIERIREAQRQLRALADEGDAPKVLLLADQDSLSIDANEAGFIRLANAFLEASSGGDARSEMSGWIENPWLPLERIALDPNPQFEPPDPKWWHKWAVYGVAGFFGVCWLIGIGTVVQWLTSHIHF